MRRQIQIVLLFLLVSTIGVSQNCYKVIKDMTGLDTSTFSAQLETIACDVRASMPLEFQNNFKVLGFGFYPMMEFMQGGFQSVWDEKVIPQANSLSQYYLLFGRQLPDSKGNAKIWVKVKLPNTNIFSCYSPQQFILLENSLEVKINNHLSAGAPTAENFVNSEIYLLNQLKAQIENLKNCCIPALTNSCSICPSPEEIREFFVAKEYKAIPIKILSPGLPTLFKQNQTGQKRELSNFTSADIKILDQVVNIGLALQHDVNEAKNEGVSATGFCTSNIDFCDNGIAAQLVNEFNYKNYAASINAHIWQNPDTTKADSLYIKFHSSFPEMSYTLPPVDITATYWECGWNPLPDISSIQNYAITKNNGTFFGYHKLNGMWLKSDSVSFYRRALFTANEKENTWNDRGAYVEDIMQFRIFRPSFRAWVQAYFTSIYPTKDLLADFYLRYKLGRKPELLGLLDEASDSIFNQFVYAGFKNHMDHTIGTSLEWNCDSKFGKALKNHPKVLEQVENLKILLNDRLSFDNLDSLFTTYKGLVSDTIDNPNLSSLPLWGFAMLGGTQGVKIEIKSISKLFPSGINSPSGKNYEIELLFTLVDNFGAGMSDGARWNIPGLVQQWVLQHYRNYDYGQYPCFIPITNHAIQTVHKFYIWE